VFGEPKKKSVMAAEERLVVLVCALKLKTP
jgi:hypothetical protein